MEPSEWRVIGESIQGSVHLRAQKPNQDAIAWYPDDGSGLPLILAVADGHGGDKYFRSDIGAQLAAKTALDVLREFSEHRPKDGELSLMMERLPAAIELQWKQAVRDHLDANPVGDGTDEPATTIGEHPARYIAYGTTLLSVLVEQDFIVYLQLGDGDILTVSPNGNVKRAIKPDPNLIANQTTSLCLPEARKYFHKQFQTIAADPPALVMLSTDGYANSFEDADFLKTGSDYLDLIRTEGIEHVNGHLGRWLSETTAKGSGDDITVGIVIAPPLEVVSKDQELPSQLEPEKPSNSGNAIHSDASLRGDTAETGLKRLIKLWRLIRLRRGVQLWLQRIIERQSSTRSAQCSSQCGEGRGPR
jgi:serine/threonine protein phosphatase PrpC